LLDDSRIAARILLVEDNPGDVRLMREALRMNGVSKGLSVVEDGEEALSFLNRRGSFSDAPRPHLIFLDLNLPRKDGREVLAEIKENTDLRLIPVIVLTTSESDTDIKKAYALHANCYVKKPTDLDEYLSVVKACESFWLHIVRLPS
jgi:two-component system, chemotaxis family, response regulator Rcp1